MGLQEDLESEVAETFRSRWEERDGRAVPDPEGLGLGNDAVKLDATVLYADMTGSTKLVDDHTPQFAAEIYKTYLVCAARIIKDNGGTITAYDGDRIMAVFDGDYKNSAAAEAALKINYAVVKIINPAMLRIYTSQAFRLRHRVGIDTSPLFVARIGVRNDNDLVWVGRAANHAAKMTEIEEDNTVFISEDVFKRLHANSKTSKDGRPMWEARKWPKMGGIPIYRSTWTWEIDLD
jgi:class 3 adenylate cyclase